MDCKHHVGYIDESYDGMCIVELGDSVYHFEDVIYYKFCPLCGDELKGDLVVIKDRSDYSSGFLTPADITRHALKILFENIKPSKG